MPIGPRPLGHPGDAPVAPGEHNFGHPGFLPTQKAENRTRRSGSHRTRSPGHPSDRSPARVAHAWWNAPSHPRAPAGTTHPPSLVVMHGVPGEGRHESCSVQQTAPRGRLAAKLRLTVNHGLTINRRLARARERSSGPSLRPRCWPRSWSHRPPPVPVPPSGSRPQGPSPPRRSPGLGIPRRCSISGW